MRLQRDFCVMPAKHRLAHTCACAPREVSSPVNQSWREPHGCHHRRLNFYVLMHNKPKNPEYLIAISLMQVRHLIYLFLII